MLNLIRRLSKGTAEAAANPLIQGYEHDLSTGVPLSTVLRHAKKQLTLIKRSRRVDLAAELHNWIERKES